MDHVDRPEIINHSHRLLLLGKILARPKRWNSKTIADFAAFAPTERGKIFPNLSRYTQPAIIFEHEAKRCVAFGHTNRASRGHPFKVSLGKTVAQ